MVYTTELSGVARKPTIRRAASGPRETGRVATGLYSECAPDADARINAAKAAPPSANHRLPIMKRAFPLVHPTAAYQSTRLADENHGGKTCNSRRPRVQNPVCNRRRR